VTGAADVTVLIPTIEERVDLLEEALASVEAQTIGAPPVFWLVDKDRNGPAYMRNDMMQFVKTEFVLFLDDDDLLYPDYLETVQPFLVDHDVVYTWCDKEGWAASYLDHDWDPEIMRGGENHLPVTACVRTEKFFEAGGFPLDAVYEDWSLWLRLMDLGARFKCVQEYKWAYRRHGGSRTHAQQVKASSGEQQTA
jgi:glycosyltransferase involved in cell wall biosynthesis